MNRDEDTNSHSSVGYSVSETVCWILKEAVLNSYLRRRGSSIKALLDWCRYLSEVYLWGIFFRESVSIQLIYSFSGSLLLLILSISWKIGLNIRQVKSVTSGIDIHDKTGKIV